ncbi:GAF domain-containing sensor histidine kinase [Leifsonia sp. NCR5]|uniref:GAF domain-containing sensor histidine kinase n=1 Tax=Leifsonia sp. NCR5 TaxID=1978342 RepID=UPI000A1942CB|nr:GAF domain-containing protein [Leifsonia sp. NCR5]
MNDGIRQDHSPPETDYSTSQVGALIEKSRRMLAAQERMQRLLRASQVVFDGIELDRVLRHIAEASVALSNAAYGALCIVDADDRPEQFILVGMPDDVAAQFEPPLRENQRLLRVLQSSVPVCLSDLVEFDDAHTPFDERPFPSAFLGVPVRVDGGAYGALLLANGGDGPFSDEDEELLTALAATAATAIGNARQYEESRRTQRLSTELGRVAATLLSGDVQETDDALGVVAEHAVDLADADLATVLTRDASTGRMTVVAARGPGGDLIEGTPSFAERLPGGSTIAVPLVASRTAVDVLYVTRSSLRRPFSSADRATVSEFAARAGLAVSESRERAQRQQLAISEDRARIARDLHDHVIQRLYAVGLALHALERTSPEHAPLLEDQIDEIDRAIGDIRTAVFALQASSAESARHRVLDAVIAITPRLRTAPHVTFSGPVDLVAVGDLAGDVVAVVRESLTNVARHAGASSCAVTVAVTDSGITVTIDDDGDGVPAHVERVSGTANLAARADARGGTYTLSRRPSGGTRAVWRIPAPPARGGGR